MEARKKLLYGASVQCYAKTCSLAALTRRQEQETLSYNWAQSVDVYNDERRRGGGEAVCIYIIRTGESTHRT
jgi:hypothetical protein